MSLLEKGITQAIAKRVEPVGTVKVVDPNPLNWLIHPQGAQTSDAPLLAGTASCVRRRKWKVAYRASVHGL